ncbi:MAG TPA: oxygenase MpaB family protein, partial [Oligoflexia bacterium]|nr:oxygenase MpaB family protein [Oligoflexia bacterium]
GYQYSANDPFALLWIHATHWYAVLRTYEVFVRTLTDAERNVYIGETKIFAMLLGIPENMIPSNWSEFKTYFDTMVSSPELTYSRDARALEQHFRVMSREVERKNPAVWIARKYSDAITASTLPKKLAEQFDFERSRTKNALYVAALSALRFSYPLIPRWGGELPLYRMAMARARGAAPDPKDELLYKAFMGRANFYQFAQEAAKIALKR